MAVIPGSSQGELSNLAIEALDAMIKRIKGGANVDEVLCKYNGEQKDYENITSVTVTLDERQLDDEE